MATPQTTHLLNVHPAHRFQCHLHSVGSAGERGKGEGEGGGEGEGEEGREREERREGEGSKEREGRRRGREGRTIKIVTA